MMVKICSKCNKPKSVYEFSRNNPLTGRRRPDCKKCVAERVRSHYAEEIDRHRMRGKVNQIKKRYGITYEQWQEMFEEQGRKCKLCNSDDPKSERGWHTDHISKSGCIVVRGILCQPCNLALGFYERDRARHAEFEAYLLNG